MHHDEELLTRDDYERLQEELNQLTTVKRREIADRLKQSREFGDISENSEYDDAKNEQARVEMRIQQITDILSRARLIRDDEIRLDSVCVGARVRLKDVGNGDTDTYQIVGSASADPHNHKISHESPVGKAILGKKVGEVVEVPAPSGTLKYKIVSIKR